MSDNYNIRDFRNAGLTSEDAAASEKSNRRFYMSVLAIPVIAGLVGLGYKPAMEIRGKSVAAVQQAELNMEAQRRADNPLYALMNGPKNAEGLIDPNANLRSGNTALSADRQRQNEFANRALNPNEFLNRVDAKAAGFSPLEMETLKYDRAVWAMQTCGHSDLRKFYVRQNETQYEKLKTIKNNAKDAKRAKQAEKSEKHFDQMQKIETKGQALAFVASGGAGRHMEAIGGFGSMSNMIGDMESQKIRSRRQRFNQRGCSEVRTIVQSGALKINPNVRL